MLQHKTEVRAETGKQGVYEGGQTVTVPAPIDVIPVMVRDGKAFRIYD